MSPWRMSLDIGDAHVVEPGHAPTPFTADEIRHGCPAGRMIRLLVEPAGAEAFLRITRFVECDEMGAVQERAQFSVDGEPMGPVQSQKSGWAELQRHASFPIAQATISEETLDTPLGRLECLRYVVTARPWRPSGLPSPCQGCRSGTCPRWTDSRPAW